MWVQLHCENEIFALSTFLLTLLNKTIFQTVCTQQLQHIQLNIYLIQNNQTNGSRTKFAPRRLIDGKGIKSSTQHYINFLFNTAFSQIPKISSSLIEYSTTQSIYMASNRPTLEFKSQEKYQTFLFVL